MAVVNIWVLQFNQTSNKNHMLWILAAAKVNCTLVLLRSKVKFTSPAIRELAIVFYIGETIT